MTTKPRTGIPGAPGLGKVVNETAWGEAKADQRYGKSKYLNGAPNPPDQCYPQFKQDQSGDRTYNDVPQNSWLRGGDATRKPYRPKGK